MGILIKPIITEKAMLDNEKFNRYTFSVAVKANKFQIKRAVENTYDVKVVDVKTINVAPKRSTKYTKQGIQRAKTNAVKKAIVSLAEGNTIELYNSNI